MHPIPCHPTPCTLCSHPSDHSYNMPYFFPSSCLSPLLRMPSSFFSPPLPGFLYSFFLSLFILRECISRGAVEKEGERIDSKHTPRRKCGLELTNLEIMTWAKIKSLTLNRLGHPGTPLLLLVKQWCKSLICGVFAGPLEVRQC